jgi:NAD-dependent dihydropyrimidine dehydrogenase PreA subunit
VSPKAILTRVQFARTLETVLLRVRRAEGAAIELEGAPLGKALLFTGDYYCTPAGRGGGSPRLITANTSDSITLAAGTEFNPPLRPGDAVEVAVRLQLPVVDPERCIGCGICEHECPVSGKRAIRVTAENETREKGHALVARRR